MTAVEVGIVELARHLNVSRESLYPHAKRLGGVKAPGPRGRYSFDLAIATAVHEEIKARSNGKKRTPPAPPKTGEILSATQRVELRRKTERDEGFAQQIANGSLRIRQASAAEMARFQADKAAFSDGRD